MDVAPIIRPQSLMRVSAGFNRLHSLANVRQTFSSNGTT